MIMSNDRPNFRGHFPLTLRRTKRNRKVQKWRYPQGIDRHMSVKKGPQPKIGYGHKSDAKGLHPSGTKEVLISSKTELLRLEDKGLAVRFSGAIGEKKRQELRSIAKEKGLKIIN